LGPLRARGCTSDSAINARKIQLVLAILLIKHDQVVTIDQLSAEIWGDHAPRRATAALQVYISQLRKFLGRASGLESPIVTRPPGYVLTVGPDELDLYIFQSLVRQGREHARAQRHEEAAASLESALGLWRGPVLSSLRDSPAVNAFAAWLEEARLECAEMLVESTLALGRHRDLIGFLYGLTAENPLREVFHRQLMLALYRAERQADALKAYRQARETLNTELGLEPCRALRELHRAILLADDRLEFQAAA
jgi:DNA-binding SARP family transcriptional activator